MALVGCVISQSGAGGGALVSLSSSSTHRWTCQDGANVQVLVVQVQVDGVVIVDTSLDVSRW